MAFQEPWKVQSVKHVEQKAFVDGVSHRGFPGCVDWSSLSSTGRASVAWSVRRAHADPWQLEGRLRPAAASGAPACRASVHSRSTSGLEQVWKIDVSPTVCKTPVEKRKDAKSVFDTSSKTLSVQCPHRAPECYIDLHCISTQPGATSTLTDVEISRPKELPRATPPCALRTALPPQSPCSHCAAPC